MSNDILYLSRCHDYVRIYADLEHELSINEKTEYQHELCGLMDIAALGQLYYSRSRALIFEFHSEPIISSQPAGTYRGFIGEYTFIDKRKSNAP
jgi:hypothetical protein